MVLWLHMKMRKSTFSYVAVVVFLYGNTLGLDLTESKITTVTSVHVGEYKKVLNGGKARLVVPCKYIPLITACLSSGRTTGHKQM